MNITIHIVPAAQAMPLQPFILPEVWEAEEREHFWYFAAMDEGALIGAAVIDPIKTGAELRSIAVSPAYTRQGVAATLLDRAIKALNYARIDTLWMTYVFTEEKWEVMDGLMKTSGFAMVDEDPVYLAPLPELMESPLLSAACVLDHVLSVAEISDLDLHHLYYAMQEKMQIDFSILQECDPAHSFVWRKTEEITAAIFLSPLKDGKVDILWMWLDAQAYNPKALMELLAAAAQQCNTSYPAETMLQFTCLVEESEHIVEHFLPKSKPILSMRTYLATTY